MAMTRRTFCAAALATCAGALTGVLAWLKRMAPRSVVTALRGRSYPGPVKPLNRAEIGTQGRWRG